MEPNNFFDGQAQLSEESLEQKRKFEELYKKQEEERAQLKEQKKVKDETVKDPRERMLNIQKEFKQYYDALNANINKFDKKKGNVDDLFKEFNDLKKYFVNTNYALTTFDKQLYKEQLEKIEKTLFQVRDLVRPRKKFRFTRREAAAAGAGSGKSEAQVQQEQLLQQQQQAAQQLDFTERVPGLKDVSKQTVRVARSDLPSTYKLHGVTDCEVHLDGALDAVYIKGVTNSKIYVGPVKSSVFVDNCKGSELHLAAHQIRIHNSEGTKFSIFTSSKCIIEHCKALVFAPYKNEYEGLQDDFTNTGLAGKENLWKDVQDFNWLKQEKSPNFSLEE